MLRHWTESIGGLLVLAYFLATLPPSLGSDKADQEAIQQAKSLSRAFRAASQKVLPTVVKVQTASSPQKAGSKQSENRNPLDDFFGGPDPGFRFQIPRPEMGLGSGVIIDGGGIILTNRHVIEEADIITIQLSDGREFAVVDKKTDDKTDIAVLKIEPAEPLPTATLGDSDQLEIGDWVLAVGNPFELEGTVSAGIISAKGRTLNTIGRTRLIQTDAAINPGNSGGALANLDGEVVGINTAIFSRTGRNEGIGFAIPINLAKWIADELLHHGRVRRAYLGVALEQVLAPSAAYQQNGTPKGVVVRQVFKDTPAQRAGLKRNDLITAFDGVPVSEMSALQELVERAPIDQAHRVAIIRDGEALEIEVKLEEMPDEAALQAHEPVEDEDAGATPRRKTYDKSLGLMLMDFDAELASGLGVRVSEGVAVIHADRNKPGAEAGLQAGMVIVRAGDQPVKDLGDWQRILEQNQDAPELPLEVVSRAGRQILVLKRPK
ncbi:MAG: PDZ domain-containing protein [Thermogutta sp.]|nr:PDZ domain-containing protein [Thermogutta sp.]